MPTALRTLELDTVTLRVGCDAVDFTPLAGLESLTLRRIGLSRGVATALVQLTQLRSLRLPGCYALEADTSPDGTALTLEPLAGVSRLQQVGHAAHSAHRSGYSCNCACLALVLTPSFAPLVP